MEYLFREAREADIGRIMEIVGEAKRQMRREGRRQWDERYPLREHIAADVARGEGRLLECAGRVVAYGAVVFAGEPAYAAIRGAWLSEGPYVVLHRLAVADEAKRCGVARKFMQRVEELARERGVGSFRVDTNFDNGYMLRLIERQGFVYCGKVRYRSGERLAFEKVLDGSAGR